MLRKIVREPLTTENGPPFNINMFKTYLGMTYKSYGQVGGMGILDLMEIGPMVLVYDVQMLEPRPYDYTKYVVDNVHSCCVNFNDVDFPTFKHYSLLMHIILYYGRLRNLWHENLKLNVQATNEEENPIQIWTSIWDYRYSTSHYLTFEDYFVQPLYMLFGYQDFILDIKRFLRPKDNGLGEKIKHN